MKKRLSHFAYNERSRSGWTSAIPWLDTLAIHPIDHTKCYLCPRHVCYPCPRSAHPFFKGGLAAISTLWKRGAGGDFL